MNRGDPVIVYTHSMSDMDHHFVDQVGLVLSEGEDCVDVVIFPPGGPAVFTKVCRFDPDTLYNAGGTYVRAPNEEVPDFSLLDYSSSEDWFLMERRQRQERAEFDSPSAVPARERAKNLDELQKRHMQERVELRKKLEHEANGGEPEPEAQPEPIPEPIPGPVLMEEQPPSDAGNPEIGRPPENGRAGPGRRL